MKHVIAIGLLLSTLLGLMPTAANADEFVNGYTRRNGTYVAPYVRSSPDRSYNNNWSVAPNVNPYTGQMGTRAPTFNDRPPTYNQPYVNPGYVAPGYTNPYGR